PAPGSRRLLHEDRAQGGASRQHHLVQPVLVLGIGLSLRSRSRVRHGAGGQLVALPPDSAEVLRGERARALGPPQALDRGPEADVRTDAQGATLRLGPDRHVGAAEDRVVIRRHDPAAPLASPLDEQPLDRPVGGLGQYEKVAGPGLRPAPLLASTLPTAAGERRLEPRPGPLLWISLVHRDALPEARCRQASASFRSVAKRPGSRSRGMPRISASRRCEGSLSAPPSTTSLAPAA